jgi:prevent-host-death family protein
MKVFSATEAKQNFGNLIATIDDEPVTIQKTNKDVAVVVSIQRYKELKKMEDMLYGEAAKLAIKEGVLSVKESEDFLNSML